MGLFSKKKTAKPEEKMVEKPAEKKPYIRGFGLLRRGFCSVTSRSSATRLPCRRERRERISESRAFSLFSVWIQDLPVLRMHRFRESTGHFLRTGRRKIRERTNIRIILRLFFRKVMKLIRRCRTRAGVYWNGNSRGQGTVWLCLPAVWEMACTADTGDWKSRENLFVW